MLAAALLRGIRAHAQQRAYASQAAGLQAAYDGLVASGSLQADARQAACIQQLSKLSSELADYCRHAEDYAVKSAQYEAARETQRLQLEEQDRRSEALAEQRQARAAPGWQQSLSGRVSSWWRSQPQGPQAGDTPAQQAIAAARAREEKLDRQLGPPPQRAPTPQGLYIYGSVGSGKSAVMDLFYSQAKQQRLVPLMRRVHFNAAMLEVNARLHRLEQERMALDRSKMQAYAARVARQVSRQQSAAAAQEAADNAELYKQDPVWQKQNTARSARLAVRRMLRAHSARKSEQKATALAASNAVMVQAAALGLIRAQDTTTAAQELWQPGTVAEGSPAGLLCFDEVQITDPFTALILKGIVEALAAEGICIVCTSNRAPWELSPAGVHEDMFAHFVGQLTRACPPFELSSERDYRRVAAAQQDPEAGQRRRHYLYPLSQDTDAALEAAWQDATAASPCTADTVSVMFGRKLEVPQAAGGVARFGFLDLCGHPLGAADYMALARRFHTVFVTSIPAMSMQVRDQARRFITLIDEMYNARTRLVCSAACAPDDLFSIAPNEQPLLDLESLQFETAVEGSRLRRDLMTAGGVAPVAASPGAAAAAAARMGGMEEQFAFKRAVSRLHEMQSPAFLKSRSREA